MEKELISTEIEETKEQWRLEEEERLRQEEKRQHRVGLMPEHHQPCGTLNT